MFVSREIRNRAAGLIAAYAVVIAGIALSGALKPAPEKTAMNATEAALERAKTRRADPCSSALQDRSDSVC
jgi:hypothetical protein